MADLIKKFFERELSGSEADSLGNLLKESPDDALRFEKFLEEHYLATGLPSPQAPPSLQNLPGVPGGLGISGLKLFALLIAAGIGVLAWKFWPAPEAASPKAALAPVVPVSELPARKITQFLPDEAKPSPVPAQKAGPMAEGNELSVVVEAKEKALVTVRVLDGQGGEIRDLFTGFVQPGRWAFKWDGILNGGQPAPSGDYQIDVQTGSLHQHKSVRVK